MKEQTYLRSQEMYYYCPTCDKECNEFGDLIEKTGNYKIHSTCGFIVQLKSRSKK